MSNILNDKQITELVNSIGRLTARFGVPEGEFFALSHDEDGWAITVVDKKEKDTVALFKMPTDLPDDNTEKAITVAGYLSIELKKFFDGKKRNANRSEAQKKASAKKAIEARWAKYYAEHPEKKRKKG